MIPRKEYLESLPKKRMGSGALIFNEQGKILFLETTYKDTWEIPGGVIEKNESPLICCKREIFEEIGLHLNIQKLLCFEYQQEDIDDSIMFIFDGGILLKNDLINIDLCSKEIKKMHFCSLDEAKEYLKTKMYKRIKKAIEAKQKNKIEYIETLSNFHKK